MKYLHPRYWLVWLGLSILWLITRLPLRMQMALGSLLGKLLYSLFKSRRKICCINLELAFPELSFEEREKINRQHFVSLVQGIFEAALSWWGNDENLRPLIQTEGEHYLDEALKADKGLIILGAHFTSLELGGRLFRLYRPELPFHVVYRPHQNKLLESIVSKARSKRYGKAIPKEDLRDMIRSLRKGFPLWYAQDQSYMGKNSIVAPFFGVPTSTNSATTRFAQLSGAPVLPFFTFRTQNNGYLLRFLPPLENFPGKNIDEDTTRINQLIESQVREFPDQYLWTHKRFKTKDEDFYQNYSKHNPDSDC